MRSTSGMAGDAIGAGDAFLSGFVDEFLSSQDIEASARAAIEVSAQTARSGKVSARLDIPQVRAAAKL